MNTKASGRLRGFTLIEVIVVVAIISILSALALTVFYNARKSARDDIRISTAEQLKLGLRLYKEAHDDYPDLGLGVDFVEIGVGGAIDGMLLPYVPHLQADPLNTGSSPVTDGEYGYWYNNVSACEKMGSGSAIEGHHMIIVRTLENPRKSNAENFCGTGGSGSWEGDLLGFDVDTPGDSYVVYIEANLY